MISQPSKVAFSSLFRYMRIHDQGKHLTTPGVDWSWFHNLGFRPFIKMYVDMGGNTIRPAVRNMSNPNAVAASDPYFVEQSEYEITVSISETDIQTNIYDNQATKRARNLYGRMYREPAA